MNTFSISEVYASAWTHTRKHLKFLVKVSLIFLIIAVVLGMVPERLSLIHTIAQLVYTVVSICFSIGMIRIALAITNGQTPTTDEFKKISFRTFLRVLWGGIITMFFTLIGIILLVIPGIIIALRSLLTSYIIVDKEISGWSAVKESWRMTRGHSWSILGVVLLGVAVVIVSMIPLGLGLIISVPYLIMVYIVMYERIRALAPASVSTQTVEPPLVVSPEASEQK